MMTLGKRMNANRVLAMSAAMALTILAGAVNAAAAAGPKPPVTLLVRQQGPAAPKTISLDGQTHSSTDWAEIEQRSRAQFKDQSIKFVNDGGEVVFLSPRAMMGILLEPISGALAGHLRITPGEAVLVTEVMAGMPAETAGMAVYDVIVACNGRRPVTNKVFSDVIAEADPGDRLNFVVLRRGGEAEIEVTMATYIPLAERRAAAGTAPGGGGLVGAPGGTISLLGTRSGSGRGTAPGVGATATMSGVPGAPAGTDGNAIGGVEEFRLEDIMRNERIGWDLPGWEGSFQILGLTGEDGAAHLMPVMRRWPTAEDAAARGFSDDEQARLRAIEDRLARIEETLLTLLEMEQAKKPADR